MSNMIRKSMDPDGEHKSPLNQGRTDKGFNNIHVKLLQWPDETMFKEAVYKATTATRGNDIAVDEQPNSKLVEEAFSGGLNQCLEWAVVTFEISGVTRGLTHELVRTRKASFSQQSGRHTDFGDYNVRMPSEIDKQGHRKIPLDPTVYPDLAWLLDSPARVRDIWQKAIDVSRDAYLMLVNDADIPYQDARTVQPVGLETYIIASYPLSVFLQTYAYRACQMFYPEIVFLFRKMKEVLVAQCPWIAPHIKISCERTAPNDDQPHMCTYQGWERVEGHCDFAWAKEDNRVWKSSVFDK